MLYMCVLKIFLADVTGVCQSLCRQHKFTLIYFYSHLFMFWKFIYIFEVKTLSSASAMIT